MSKLANFSVETDRVVLLQFRDGRERRVLVSRLAEYLGSADLARVSAAVKLRQSFLKDHMPRLGGWAMLAGAATAAFLLAGGGATVAQLVRPAVSVAPVPSPAGSGAVPVAPGSTGAPSYLRDGVAAQPSVMPANAVDRPGAPVAKLAGVLRAPGQSKALAHSNGHSAASLLNTLLPGLAMPDPAPSVRVTPWPDPAAETSPSASPTPAPTTTPSPAPEPSPSPSPAADSGANH